MNIQQQKLFKVLIIGDSCQDIFVYGNCERLNPEAPVPILNYKKTIIKEGMASNVKENLLSFGLDVTLITNKEEITKTRYIDEKSNHQIIRVDNECKISPLTDNIFADLYDIIVISDYNKGFITSGMLFNIVDSAKCPIFIDSKKNDLPKNNCIIKINETEYSKLNNKELHNNIIVTMGSNGSVYNNTLYPAEKVNVYDTVGAGDTFLAALVYGYLNTKNIGLSIKIANKASAIAVSHQGTYVLTKNDVNKICNLN
jgi:D-beta-D-heptose 7-phosphate kinase/D-beta-D-heptose 1-phosphate adenosyltransferase